MCGSNGRISTGLCDLFFPPVCTQVVQPGAIPDVGGNEGISPGLDPFLYE